MSIGKLVRIVYSVILEVNMAAWETGASWWWARETWGNGRVVFGRRGARRDGGWVRAPMRENYVSCWQVGWCLVLAIWHTRCSGLR